MLKKRVLAILLCVLMVTALLPSGLILPTASAAVNPNLVTSIGGNETHKAWIDGNELQVGESYKVEYYITTESTSNGGFRVRYVEDNAAGTFVYNDAGSTPAHSTPAANAGTGFARNQIPAQYAAGVVSASTDAVLTVNFKYGDAQIPNLSPANYRWIGLFGHQGASDYTVDYVAVYDSTDALIGEKGTKPGGDAENPVWEIADFTSVGVAEGGINNYGICNLNSTLTKNSETPPAVEVEIDDNYSGLTLGTSDSAHYWGDGSHGFTPVVGHKYKIDIEASQRTGQNGGKLRIKVNGVDDGATALVLDDTKKTVTNTFTYTTGNIVFDGGGNANGYKIYSIKIYDLGKDPDYKEEEEVEVPPSLDDEPYTEIYKLSEDPDFADATGEVLKETEGTTVLKKAGSPTISAVAYNGGKSLKVETPASGAQNYFGIDIKGNGIVIPANGETLDLNSDTTFTIKVVGHTDEAPAGGSGLVIQDFNPSKWGNNISGTFDGTNFTIFYTGKPSSLVSGYKSGITYRIQHASAPFISTYYIDEIIVSYGTVALEDTGDANVGEIPETGTVFYNMQTDLASAADGYSFTKEGDTAFPETAKLAVDGSNVKATVKVSGTNKSLLVTGREKTWEGVGIIPSRFGDTFNNTDKHYTVIVKGRAVEGKVIRITKGGDGSSTYATDTVGEDGFFDLEYKFNGDPLSTIADVRIQSNESAAPYNEFYIDQILIMEVDKPNPDTNVYYNMYTDSVHMESTGTLESSFLGITVSSVTATVEGNNVKSIKVSTRSADWHGLNLNLGRMGLKEGEPYKIIIKGRVIDFDAGAAATNKLLFKISEAQSPWKDWKQDPVEFEADGSFVINTSMRYQTAPTSYSTVRIQSASGTYPDDDIYTPDFYIDSIIVMGMDANAPSVPKPEAAPVYASADPTQTTAPETVKTTVVAKEDGTAVAQVKQSDFGILIDKALAPLKPGEPERGPISIEIKPSADTKELTVSLPAVSVDKIANEAKVGLIVDTGIATLNFDVKSLQAIVGEKVAETGEIKLVVKVIEDAKVSGDDKKKLGTRPVIDFSITNDGKKISDFNGGKVTVNLSYALAPGEVPNALVVYYIDDKGNMSKVNGKYRAATKKIEFDAKHFSTYAVGYNYLEFTDVPKGSEVYQAVTFLAAREVTVGIGDNKFGVDNKLTRAMFIVMLLRAFDIEPDAKPTDNFDDAGNTWYTGYLSAAKRLGITVGTGDNKFSPDVNLTEWQLQTLLDRTLKELECAGYNVSVHETNSTEVTRGVMANTMYDAMNAGLFTVGGTLPAMAAAKVLYDMSADEELLAIEDGEALPEEMTNLEQAGRPTLTVKGTDTKSILVTGRSVEYDTVDVKCPDLLDKNSYYEVTVTGRTAPNTVIKLSHTNGSATLGNVTSDENGDFEVSAQFQYTGFKGIRTQTDNGVTKDIEITGIIVKEWK